jgi:hypothetical protein
LHSNPPPLDVVAPKLRRPILSLKSCLLQRLGLSLHQPKISKEKEKLLRSIIWKERGGNKVIRLPLTNRQSSRRRVKPPTPQSPTRPRHVISDHIWSNIVGEEKFAATTWDSV